MKIKDGGTEITEQMLSLCTVRLRNSLPLGTIDAKMCIEESILFQLGPDIYTCIVWIS